METNEKVNDCGCEGDCCPPKKKNPLRMILFALVILAALGIVAFKLTRKEPPAEAAKSCCPPGSTSCDTTKTKTCDTTQGKSCCPK